MVELRFQIGLRAEAHFANDHSPTGRHKETVIESGNPAVRPDVRNYIVDQETIALFTKLDTDAKHGTQQWWTKNGGRLGIPGTLHRLPAIKGTSGQLIGVIIQIGRSMRSLVEQMLPSELIHSNHSTLLIGPPGSVQGRCLTRTTESSAWSTIHPKLPVPTFALTRSLAPP